MIMPQKFQKQDTSNAEIIGSCHFNSKYFFQKIEVQRKENRKLTIATLILPWETKTSKKYFKLIDSIFISVI